MRRTLGPRPDDSGKKENRLSRLFSLRHSQKKVDSSNGESSILVPTDISGSSTPKISLDPSNENPETNGQDTDKRSSRGGNEPQPEQLEPNVVDLSDPKDVVSSPESKPVNGDGDVARGANTTEKDSVKSNLPAAQSDQADAESHSNTSSSDPLRDFWAEAWNSDEVGEERRNLLRDDCAEEETDSQELVNGVIEHTQDKLATYTKRWGSDEEKTAAGVARSILLSALTVKDLVDAGLKFDPTGYGSSAWAVVSFGLKLVQNDKERVDLTFDACGYLASIMARYSRMEAHYRERQVKKGKPLEDAMINVYTAILLYSAEVKGSLKSSVMNRVKRSFISLTGQPLEDLKKKIDKENTTVEEWQRQIDRERQDEDAKKILDIEKKADEMLESLKEAANTITEVKEIGLAEDLRETFRWLFSEERAGQQKTHKELRDAIEEWESLGDEEGERYRSGDWFINGKEYVEWKKYPQSLLWLYGSSGCGKSSLCSTIIQSLGDAFDDDDTKVLVYWYFRFYLDETKSIDLLIRSLLRQLGSKCKGFADLDMLKWFRSYRDSGRPLKTDRLFQQLNKFIQSINKDVFIVLDGLDEFPELHPGAGRRKLLDIITKLVQQGYPNLHILLVSRDEKDIRSCLETNMSDILVAVNVKKGLDKDLDNFIQKTLDKTKILSPSLKGDVKRRLNQGQDRNFLWATSLLTEVAQCREAKDVPEVLKKIPGSMVAVYDSVLENVKAEDVELMRHILLWLLRQLRPLSRDELAAAVGLVDASSVTQICTKTLVESSNQRIVVARKDIVLEVFRFAHFSVKEYLESVISGLRDHLEEKPKVARFVFSGEDAHLQMTRHCLDVLSACSRDHVTEFKEGDANIRPDYSNADSDDGETDIGDVEQQLVQYAAEFWFQHYKQIDRERISNRDLELLDKKICLHLRPGSTSFAFWLKTYDPDNRSNEHGYDDSSKAPSPVYYAIKLELEGIPEQLITQIEDVGILERPGHHGTALQIAVHQGHYSILEALLKRGVDVNAKAGLHGTALYAAAARGDGGGVVKLLGAGANPNGSTDGDLGSPLHVAAFRGHDTVVKELLDRGSVDVDHRAGLFGTALQAAAASRKRTTVQLLLESGADPNVVCGCLGTALQAAFSHHPGSSGGKIADKIVDILRSAGAKYQDKSNFWTIAFDRATREDSIPDSYMRLIRDSGSYSKDLRDTQWMLASAIHQWTLPDKRTLTMTIPFRNLLCRIPFQDQLEEILQAVPQLTLDIDDLSRKDFLHQSLFWAGINHIMHYLEPLIDKCLDRAFREVTKIREAPSPDSTASAAYALRWAVPGREGRHGHYETGMFRSKLLRNVLGWRRLYDSDDTRNMSPMARSDLVAMELKQQREKENVFEKIPAELSKELGSRNRVRGLEGKLLGARSEVLVTSDILCLVRALVQHGSRCTRYQDTALEKGESFPLQTAKVIQEYTFELFSTVIRLVLALDNTVDFVRLSPTVQLLTMARLGRIEELGSRCERDPALVAAPPPQTNSKEREEEMAARIAQQVQGIIVNQVTDIQASMVQEIRSQVSSVIREEMGRLREQLQQDLEEKIQEEVQLQILEAQAEQSQGGWFSTIRPWS